ncbi:MAG: hypothetical protein U0L59_05835 [Faecalimonas sp.]|nr:hypothetical protein [Faecalimonas sp.]
MKKDLTFSLDNDVYEKFCIALRLANENENDVIENCVRAYIAKTFEKVSQEYSCNTGNRMNVEMEKDYYGKAIQRIPVWALKPNQYNHKIIRAFFEAEESTGEARLDTMELLCSNKSKSELYVPTFRNNYSQMKIDGPKSHGKVFEDDGERVWIWKEVESVLRKYKESFLRR